MIQYLLKILEARDKVKNIKWYSPENLLKRNPQYIAINSLYYQRFLQNKNKARLYPELNQFFKNLIEEKDYKIVFAQESNKYPSWIYSQNIDFLNNKMIILVRKEVRK